MITDRQPVMLLGFTHASSVIPAVTSSDGASGMLTRLLTPLKLSAAPYRPCATHVAPEIVPLLPLPDVSATVVPEPASMLYARTKQFELGGGALDTDTVTAGDVP